MTRMIYEISAVLSWRGRLQDMVGSAMINVSNPAEQLRVRIMKCYWMIYVTVNLSYNSSYNHDIRCYHMLSDGIRCYQMVSLFLCLRESAGGRRFCRWEGSLHCYLLKPLLIWARSDRADWSRSPQVINIAVLRQAGAKGSSWHSFSLCVRCCQASWLEEHVADWSSFTFHLQD